MGLGLTGTVVLRSGRLSDLLSQLQELTTGVNDAETSQAYDGAFLAAQVLMLGVMSKDCVS